MKQFKELILEKLTKEIPDSYKITGQLESTLFQQKMKFKLIRFDIEQINYLLIKLQRLQVTEPFSNINETILQDKTLEKVTQKPPNSPPFTLYAQGHKNRIKSFLNQKISEATFNEEDDQINECTSSELLEVAEEKRSEQYTPNSVDISKLSYATSPQKLPLDQEEFCLENFTAMIIHDFRTPLFCITLMLEKLKSEDLDNNSKTESIEIAETNTTLLENYVNDILDLKQLNNGKLSISPEQFNLQKFIVDVNKVMQPLASLKQTILSIDYQYDSSFMINTDQRRLKQILVNLLSNAIKFTNQGQIEIKVYQVFGNFVQFSIKDTGCGINPEVIPLLAQPYKTFNSNGMNKQGIGLGLFFCKKLIGKLGPEEKLRIESQCGIGSVFSFKVFRNLSKMSQAKDVFKSQIFQSEGSDDHLQFQQIKLQFKLVPPRLARLVNPRELKALKLLTSVRSIQTSTELTDNFKFHKKSYSQQVIKLQKESSSSFYQRCNYCFLEEEQQETIINIMIVDDQPFNLMILETYLKAIKNYKFLIHKAYNGQEAIESFKKNNLITNKNNVQIIIMDCEMPITNGYIAAKAIKKLITEKYFIPAIIIAHSAYQDSSSVELCQESQFDGVLKKPSGIQEFEDFLREIIQNMQL